MSEGRTRITVRNHIPTIDYVYEIARIFNRGEHRVRLYATGDEICKLADIVAVLPERVPGTVRIVGWDIGNRRVRGERKSYLELELEYTPPF